MHRTCRTAMLAISIVAILALSALLLFFLQRRFFAPLLSFAAAASKIRDGDYAGRISEDAPKEFKSFITVFNSMAVKVGVKEAELEHRVASRTEEYRDAHAKLEQATNALVRQEKMASIGRLASGVAHEINNPIGYIQANLKAMAEYVEDFRAVIGAGDELGRALSGGSAQDIAEASRALEQTRREKDIDYLMGDAGLLLADSRKGAIRIGEIVQGLRSFAREDGGSQECCDINAILAASLRMVESKLKYNCAVERDFGALSPVKGNPGELEQVFVNLLVNAGDAIGEIGTIRVTSRSEGDSIKVTVSDDGSGMDAPTLGRIFEPFFTTKDVGKGTGLGLAISQGIIEKHRGRIEVESRVGRGTTFTVTMPFAAAERKEMAV